MRVWQGSQKTTRSTPTFAGELAETLTTDDGYFGAMLNGNVGGGKTTLMKALQKLLVMLNCSVGIKSICLFANTLLTEGVL